MLVIEAIIDHAHKVALNVGTVLGGTHENIVPPSHRLRVNCPVLTPEDERRRRLVRAAPQPPQDPERMLAISPGLSQPP